MMNQSVNSRPKQRFLLPTGLLARLLAGRAVGDDRFTGKIDKLTFRLGPTQLSGDEQRIIQHAALKRATSRILSDLPALRRRHDALIAISNIRRFRRSREDRQVPES